ncbi:DMT family transporter [Mycolicibacterium pallens]|uniref:DMT family transporter n=1 Tax=Mycolicibacterium pallens TaxID=370524 RepID=A0ABX8VR20_9MYCO|nr:DMT family transporter [Mycolicibacterium pallens]QYL19518.1 DMT family transporter [Mycolicibacterium pallens]
MPLPTTHIQIVDPRIGLAVGALCVASSAVFLDLADTTAATASTGRCLLALPVIGALAIRERRCAGALSRSGILSDTCCGALFAGDMLWWTEAIREIGAGLSTVLVNTQVLLVPLLAWMVDRERIERRFLMALPVMLTGVVLTGGLVGHAGHGDAGRGTVHAIAAALCYSGFLFLLRRGGKEGLPVQTYAVVLVTAAATAAAAGQWWGGLDTTPSRPTIGWLILVTLTGQLVGWLLVAKLSPKVGSETSSVLLLLTPVGALIGGMVILGERPTGLQLVGCALVIVAAYAVVAHRHRESGP